MTFYRFLTLFVVAFAYANVALAEDDCPTNPRDRFIDANDEVTYFAKYHSCLAEKIILSGVAAQSSQFGKGLEIFTHPDYIEAIGFSKVMCKINANYPCWFEEGSIGATTTIDQAAKLEAPKVLLVQHNPSRGQRNPESVEYVLCLNDDPTKPKEYTRACERGYKMEVTEYGRTDMNKDGSEDLVVRLRYGINHNTFRQCYIAAFSRKQNELAKMIYYSPVGQCQ